MKRRFLRTVTFLLSVLILFGVFPTVSAEEKSEPIYVLAGSDFQAQTDEAGVANTKAIISAVKADGITSIDGFLFAGDYNTAYDDKTSEITNLKNAVKDEYPTLKDENMVFVQGNHDPATSGGLSKSGGNDTDDYGVFVINEDDYMWYNDNEATIKNTAASLESYLKAKSDEGYSKPVFIVSHLALNYSRRTYNDGDGMYAKYIFDVLNLYGESLNIIFMFGHNHSSRYDDYIGGSAVYLTVGDVIYIAEPGDKTAVPDAYTLNFTYLNAGYVGYANCLNNALTMTAFVITDGVVEIRRYSADGRFALKTQGAWVSSFNETAKTYGTVDDYLLIEYTGSDFVGNSASNKEVTVISSDITGLSVTKDTTASFPDIQTAYISYEITPQGYSDGSYAYVKVALDQSFDLDAPVFARNKKTNAVVLCTVQNGTAIFLTNSLGSFELYQTKPIKLSEQQQTVYVQATQFTDGKDYLVVSANSEAKEAYALQNKEGNALTYAPVEIKSGYGSVYIIDDDPSIRWNFINDTDFGYADIIGDLQNAATGQYLVAEDGADLSTTENIEEDYTAWRVASNQYGIYTRPHNRSGATGRWYVKFDNRFVVSETEDATRRVYLFEGMTVDETVTAYLDGALGSVNTGAGADALTGSKLYLVHTDGSVQTVEIALSMLQSGQGNSVDTEENGIYSDLQVVYDGIVVCSNYTLSIETVVQPSDSSDSVSSGSSLDENAPQDADGQSLVWVLIVIVVLAGALVTVMIVVRKNKKAKTN